MVKRVAYQSYPVFALRSPLLPLDELESLKEDPSGLFDQFRRWWSDTMIRDSIYLASPDFFRELDRQIGRDKITPDLIRLSSGFIRYLLRMSSRCTPFGLFAGFGLGSVGQDIHLERDVKEKNRIHLRLDMEYLAAYARRAAENPDRVKALNYRPNNTLYKIGQQWRYVEVILLERGQKSYELIHLENNEVLPSLFNFAGSGKSMQEMISFISSIGWDEETVHGYLLELIGSQVLVSQFEPVVSGMNFMEHLSGLLANLPDNDGLGRGLHQIEERIKRLSIPGKLSVNAAPLLSELDTLGIPYRENRILQGDMMLNNNGLKLDQAIVDRVLFGIRIRRALSNMVSADPLASFKEAFLRRFGEGRVPLLIALDPETGIGLDGSELHYLTDPVPLVDDLKLPGRAGPVFKPNSVGQVINPVFWPTDDSEYYRDITKEDIRHLPLHEGSWPDQLQVMVELTKGPTDETIIHLHHCSGGHPAFLMARFAHVAEPETGGWISQMLDDEERGLQDGILAEIVHLPEDRTGNVLQRPSFCKYEIPYLAQSLKPDQFQIPASDLMVSVEDHSVKLHSKKLGKRIYPKLTNAHNYMHGKLAVYQLLCKLQEQNQTGSFTPDPGPDTLGECFTSGIRFENLILRNPVWKISIGAIASLFNAQGDPDMAGLDLWRNRYGIPEKTLWIDGDHELYIRWTHPILVTAAWETMKKYRRVRLRPYPYDEGSLLTRPEGEKSYHFANQIILAYKRSDLQ